MISQQEAKTFYKITKDTLNDLAAKHNVKDIGDYYKLTDFNTKTKLGRCIDKLGRNSVESVFVQMAFHAQNATLISNIVRFEDNIDFLEKVLCGFDPKDFLTQYKCAKDVVEALRYDATQNQGLKWNDKKNKTARKDSLITGYAECLIYCAKYLKDFTDRKAVLGDLKCKSGTDYENLIKAFQKEIPHRFSIALTCDFLKEFDEEFSFLCKPDVHIKDTLCVLLNKGEDYYRTSKREYECIGEMQKLVELINEGEEKKITVYQLDRMIWLICSEKFFLDGVRSSKSEYLAKIASILFYKRSEFMPTVEEAWRNYVKNVGKANSLISSVPEPDSLLAAELKELLRGISNLATRILSKEFIDWLEKAGMLPADEAGTAKIEIDGTSANSNGYDIVLPKGIVAEVKCMIPLEDKKYGAQQQSSIVKDLDGLLALSPKKKSSAQLKKAKIQWGNYIKFMVLLNKKNAIVAFEKIPFEEKIRNRFNIVNCTGKIDACPNIVNVVFLPCEESIIAAGGDSECEKVEEGN